LGRFHQTSVLPERRASGYLSQLPRSQNTRRKAAKEEEMTTVDEFVYALIETAACTTPSATVRELARKIGVAESTVGNWRKGKTKLPFDVFCKLWPLVLEDDLMQQMFEEVMNGKD
jgi:transcriptional regulator with XRE-family HTH domain